LQKLKKSGLIQTESHTKAAETESTQLIKQCVNV